MWVRALCADNTRQGGPGCSVSFLTQFSCTLFFLCPCLFLLQIGRNPKFLLLSLNQESVGGDEEKHLGSAKPGWLSCVGAGKFSTPASQSRFHLKKKLTYLFLVVLGLHCCRGLLSSCGDWVLVCNCGAWTCHCGGFSCWSKGFRHAGFISCGSWALEHRLRSCGIWA